MQGKSLSCRRYTLELLPTCEYMGLRSHPPQSTLDTPQALPRYTPNRTPDTPPDAPLPLHPHSPLSKSACNSRTGVTQQHEVIQTNNILRRNCMRNCRTPHCAPEKSHVIPPGPHSPTARKPRNINDLISRPETPSGELRAKLLSTCHGSTFRSPPRGLDTHTRTTGAAGVEGAGGTGGHGRASRRGAERSEAA